MLKGFGYTIMAIKSKIFQRTNPDGRTDGGATAPAESPKPSLVPYVLVAPFALLLASVPIGFVGWAFCGFSNFSHHVPYEQALIGVEVFDSRFGGLLNLLSGFAISVPVALLSTAIALLAVRALNFYEFPGREFFLMLSRIRFTLPAACIGIGIHAMFELYGMGGTAVQLGLVQLLFALPFSLSIIKSCLSSGSRQLEEHARVLGATSRSAFFMASLPSLTPGLTASAVVALLLSMTQYILETVRFGETAGGLMIIGSPLIQGNELTVYFSIYILPAAFMFVALQAIIRALVGPGSKE
ncbi:MAG: hypothetical protein LBH39_00640 [Clostridiales Family XIII bacterium]|nr:hypothetical protein [Clostridiales Family XIII bacterium]